MAPEALGGGSIKSGSETFPIESQGEPRDAEMDDQSQQASKVDEEMISTVTDDEAAKDM